jgi:hypothetical protein
LFKGTFEECLDRIRRGDRDDLRKLKDFADVSLATAMAWLYDPSLPAGDTWMRCVVFFRLQQWEVKEFDDSDPLRVAIAEGIAFGVVDHLELLGAAKYVMKRSGSPLHTFVYGDHKLLSSSRALLEIFFSSKTDVLATKREEALKKYRLRSPEEEDDAVVLSVVDRLRLLLKEAFGDDNVEKTAALLAAVVPFVEVICEDDSVAGAKARQRLRELVGLEIYGHLSVQLNMMRSRAAYERAQRGEVN